VPDKPKCNRPAHSGTFNRGFQDSEDIGGTLLEQYQRSFAFIRRNLHHVQRGRGFNTLGELEIPETALEELLVNALIHRDYFTSASIRLMVFTDRVEIASPGHLPDGLSIEAIRQGRTNRRNPTLTEHASQILPYRGMSSGIPRALKEWPRIELADDVVGNQFSAVVWRPESEWAASPVTPPVAALLALLAEAGELANADIRARLKLKDRTHVREYYIEPALAQGLIEYTLPGKPNSRLQKYRLTAIGQAGLQTMDKDRDALKTAAVSRIPAPAVISRPFRLADPARGG
jgi:predicted HTH transcriptional regulator